MIITFLNDAQINKSIICLLLKYERNGNKGDRMTTVISFEWFPILRI